MFQESRGKRRKGGEETNRPKGTLSNSLVLEQDQHKGRIRPLVLTRGRGQRKRKGGKREKNRWRDKKRDMEKEK